MKSRRLRGVVLNSAWRVNSSFISDGKKKSRLRHFDMQMKGVCEKLFFFSSCGRAGPKGGTLTGSRCCAQSEKLSSYYAPEPPLCFLKRALPPPSGDPRVWKLLFIPLETVCSFSHSICQRLGGQAPQRREGCAPSAGAGVFRTQARALS